MKKLLFIIIILGWALAQPSESLLQSYELAIESLDQAIHTIDEDPAVAGEALVRAELTLRPMSADSVSPELIKALETTFDHAKIAIRNKSSDDLVIQSQVLKGGYWRLLYEAAINSDSVAPAALKAYLLRMAKDMGLSDFSATVEAVNQPLSLIAEFEKAIAHQAAANIAAAANTDDMAEKYRHLAVAYSLFLPVQDSPRSPSFTSNLFAKAFQEVVANDTEALAATLARLSEVMNQFEAASSQFLNNASVPASQATAPDGLSPASSSQEVNPTVPMLENNVTQAVALSAENTQAAASAAMPTLPVENAAAPVSANNNLQASPAVNTGQGNSPVLANNMQANNDQVMLRIFNNHGIRNPAMQQALLAKYKRAGISDPNDLQDVFYAQSAKMAVALESGDQGEAKLILQDMKDKYSELLAPLNSFNDPGKAEATIGLMDNLLKSPGLRVQDAIVLAGQMGETSLNAGAAPLMHKAIVSTTNIWSGWVRLIFAIVFGILAFVPLYLLVLAFGGGNKNWQLVGWSLFLLLLPMIYEGISYIATLIASLTGITILEYVSSFSIFQNGLSQAIWFVLSGIAIILAIAGLYGICVQFGLLGKRSQSSGKTTVLEPSVTESAVQTNFDWDEEFEAE